MLGTELNASTPFAKPLKFRADSDRTAQAYRFVFSDFPGGGS